MITFVDRLHQWAIGTAGALVAAALTALALQGWKAWVATVIAIVAATLLIVFLTMAWLHTPRLTIHFPLVKWEPTTGPIVAFPGHQAYLHISNTPRRGSFPVDRVYVTLRCVRESDGAVIWEWGEVFARWSFLPKVTLIEETMTARYVTIFPIDPPHRIDVAIQILGTDSLGEENATYIISDETSHLGLRRPLGPDPMLIEVRAQGVAFGRSIADSKSFRLVQPAGQALELLPVPKEAGF